MNKKNHINTKKRLALILLAVGLLFVGCMAVAVRLVVKKGDEYRHEALSQAVGTGTAIAARPGNILDCNGVALALTKKVYRLILDPKVMAETEKTYPGSLEKTVCLLSEAFGLDQEALRECFLADTTLAYYRYPTSELLSESQVENYEKLVSAFEAEKTAYNQKASKENKIKAKVAGVWFEEEYRREYPQNSLLSKVIGYTTADATQGILGLELYYNDLLHGTDGKSYSYIAEDGSVTREVVAAEDGVTLRTSLDVNVARALREGIQEFQEELGGKRVAVLCMNVKTGEILAMESDTEFDLNNPTDLSGLFTEEELEDPSQTYLLQELYKTEKQKEKLNSMTAEEKRTALLQQVQSNFCVSGTYEPGSTSKAVTLAAGIEEGVFDRDDTFCCDGSIQVNSYTIHCHMDTLCGWLTPMEALGRSCNVCYVQMGEAEGAALLSKYQEILNLGQKTGIDLPGEASTASLIYTEEELHEVELATCSFGQGFNVTMVQFASLYCSLINGGYYYQPHVVTGTLDQEGNVLSEVKPVLVRRTVSEETSEYLLEALNYVTVKGTATEAVTEGYRLAGKTGAAEKLPRGTGKYVVSFISAAPADDPEYLIYALVDEPNSDDQSMSWPAQHLARYCWEKLYSYFNIYPDSDPDAYSYDWSSLKDFSGESDSMEEGIISENSKETE